MKAATFDDVQRAIAEGRLRVSTDGIVEGKRQNPKAQWRKKSLENVFSPHQTTPYQRTTFVTSNGERYRILVHRLVWYVHNGPIPNHLTINHKNGKKTDNRLENLELMTQGENQKHAFKNDLKHPTSNLSNDQVVEVKTRLLFGERQSDIARSIGVDFWTVNRIKRGVTFKNV